MFRHPSNPYCLYKSHFLHIPDIFPTAPETSHLARMAGVEPATLGVEVPCSVQLSYIRIWRSC